MKAAIRSFYSAQSVVFYESVLGILKALISLPRDAQAESNIFLQLTNKYDIMCEKDQ